MFEVIEKNILGKNEKCEDIIVITENYVVVADGVTSKGNELINGKTSGEVASELIKEYLALYKMGKSPSRFFTGLSMFFADYIRSNTLEHNKPKASIIVYNDEVQEIWNYGDCRCLVDGEYYSNRKEIDNLMGDLRSFLITCYIEGGKQVEEILQCDSSRQMIIPFIRQQSILENKMCDYGYPVVNGDQIIEEYIRTINVRNNSEVILATDGYPKIFATLDESEKYLSTILLEDPLMYRIHKETKGKVHGNRSFDDRAFVRLRLSL